MLSFFFEKAARIFAAMIVCNVTYISFHAIRQKINTLKHKSDLKYKTFIVACQGISY